MDTLYSEERDVRGQGQEGSQRGTSGSSERDEFFIILMLIVLKIYITYIYILLYVVTLKFQRTFKNK